VASKGAVIKRLANNLCQEKNPRLFVHRPLANSSHLKLIRIHSSSSLPSSNNSNSNLPSSSSNSSSLTKDRNINSPKFSLGCLPTTTLASCQSGGEGNLNKSFLFGRRANFPKGSENQMDMLKRFFVIGKCDWEDGGKLKSIKLLTLSKELKNTLKEPASVHATQIVNLYHTVFND
jgi:hypothetical protein